MAMGTPGERPDRRGFPIRDSSRSHRHKGRADSSAARLRHAAAAPSPTAWPSNATLRSEEHTSELQSLMRISYAVFCLKKKIRIIQHQYHRSRYRCTAYSNNVELP